ADGVRRGIVEAGGNAVDVGIVPTPALYFAVNALGTDGGVQVTGSHNPPEFNGFKLVLGGEAFHGAELLELWEILVPERWRTGAELGIAFDGDADRIGAVDETGEIVYGDQLLVILGRDAVRRFGPGTPVIFDVKCSEVLPAALAQAGAEPVMWKTGHSLIKAK